jgi:hypothetical protein
LVELGVLQEQLEVLALLLRFPFILLLEEEVEDRVLREVRSEVAMVLPVAGEFLLALLRASEVIMKEDKARKEVMLSCILTTQQVRCNMYFCTNINIHA